VAFLVFHQPTHLNPLRRWVVRHSDQIHSHHIKAILRGGFFGFSSAHLPEPSASMGGTPLRSNPLSTTSKPSFGVAFLVFHKLTYLNYLRRWVVRHSNQIHSAPHQIHPIDEFSYILRLIS
jgi:hypothetical protein